LIESDGFGCAGAGAMTRSSRGRGGVGPIGRAAAPGPEMVGPRLSFQRAMSRSRQATRPGEIGTGSGKSPA
jgi:hypothetical protein